MTRPYELLVRFRPDGTVAGASIRTITTVNGRDYEGDPTPLSGSSDPAFLAFASAFSAAVVAERDSLQSQLQSLTEQQTQIGQQHTAELQVLIDEKQSLIAQHAAQVQSLESRIATLQSELDALQTNTTVVTAVRGRIALKRAGLLETVEQAVTTANGETQIWWEYAAEWHRNSPVLEALGHAIGLTDHQIDELFAVAAGIA